MTIEEYKQLVGTATPENFQSVLTDVLKAVQDDFSIVENLNTQISEQDKKIRDLQDTNQKLFLSQTSPVKDPEEEKDLFEQEVEALKDKKGIDILK